MSGEPLYEVAVCIHIQQDEFGANPLLTACACNHLEIVNFLINNGASVNFQNKVLFIVIMTLLCMFLRINS